MSNKSWLTQERCENITFWLFVAFLVWTLFTIWFGLLVNPPGPADRVFIALAKPYYFEKSSVEDKEYEFRSSRSLWLSVPGVTNVIMAGEAKDTDLDVLEAPYICYLVIDGQTINVHSDEMTASQRTLYEDVLKQISAKVWKSKVSFATKCIAVWMALLVALVIFVSYLKKRFCWKFTVTISSAA